jgi:hypothetical protein
VGKGPGAVVSTCMQGERVVWAHLSGRCGAIGAHRKRGLRADGATRRLHVLVRILVRCRHHSDAHVDPASVEPSERPTLIEPTRRLLTGLIRIEGEDERSGRRAREQRRDCELELEIGQSGAQARNSIPATESAQAHPKRNQWPSVAISGNPWQSVAITGNYWQLLAISGNHEQVRARNASHAPW